MSDYMAEAYTFLHRRYTQTLVPVLADGWAAICAAFPQPHPDRKLFFKNAIVDFAKRGGGEEYGDDIETAIKYQAIVPRVVGDVVDEFLATKD